MKSIIIAGAIAVAAMGASTLSSAQERDWRGAGRDAPRVEQQAQPPGDRDGRESGHRAEDGRRYQQGNNRNHAGRDDRHDRYGRQDRQDRHDRYDRYDRYGRYDGYDRYGRYDGGRDNRYYGAPSYQYYGARGPHFYRGARIPVEYRSPVYVVGDWRSHRLSAPPRGQHWVQVGPDYVLVAIATGVIVQLLLGY